MNLASFDIFDTILIRKCGSPEGVFYILAHRLFPDDESLRTSFFVWRKRAESLAMRKYNSQNITLEQIYSTIEPIYCTQYSHPELAEIERNVEASQLSVNPAIKKLIEKKRCDGYSICFISDMYLDSSFLKELLVSYGVMMDDEEVFVSCEYKKRKSDGRLYDIVSNKYTPQTWEHYGDNKHSDVVMAKRKRVRATLVDTSYTQAEQHVIESNKRMRNRIDLSIYVGFLRYARISNGNDGYAEIASNFVSTLYVPFVINLLEKATQNGIQNIYFLNRDSYIFLKIAETLKGIYPALKFKYLYVSRKSLILPYLYKRGAADFLAVMDANTIIKKEVKSLLSYLNLSDEEIHQHGISFNYKTIGDKDNQNDFLDKIFNSKITALLQSKAKEQRDLLLAYFKQEGIIDRGDKLLVDVGWLGTTRLMINGILRLESYDDVTFGYLGVRGDAIGVEHGKYYTHYLPDTLPQKVVALVEQYFSASPYSTTLGYEEVNGEIISILKGSVDSHTTHLVDVNSGISSQIASLTTEYTFLNWSEIFLKCETAFFSILTNQQHKINVHSFVQCAEFDSNVDNRNMRIVKKISLSEVFSYTFMGADVTVLDYYSLKYTYGNFIAKRLYAIHQITSKLRVFLYRLSLRINR